MRLILAALILTTPTFGQSPLKLELEATKCHGTYCEFSTEWGTAFPIWQSEKDEKPRSILMTARHNVLNVRSMKIHDGSKKTVAATVYAIHPDCDVALLQVRKRYRPLKLGKRTPPIGTSVTLHAWKHPWKTQRLYARGRVTLPKTKHGFDVSLPSQPGCSGGYVLCDGLVCGVVVATTKTQTLAVKTAPLKQWLLDVRDGRTPRIPQTIRSEKRPE